MNVSHNVILIFLIFLCSNAHGIDKNAPITFADAAALAVAASADLNHSRASQEIMEGAWKWGLRAFLPQLSLNISENDRLQVSGADSFVKNYGINLDQLIWDYKTTMTRKLERMEIDLSESRLDRMTDEIGESAIAAYRNTLSSRAILDIKISALSVLEEQRRILNEEVRLGLALDVDLASADINLADAKLDIYSLQLELAEMEKQFAELMGLETLPVLTEKVDINRSAKIIPLYEMTAAPAASSLARIQNPDLTEARHSIAKKQMEYKFASSSWIPSLRLTGNFNLTGQRYPLTRYNWSVGINIDFSGPWIQNRFAAQAGWELSTLGKYDQTAMLQNSFTPIPNPAAAYGRRNAALSLALEEEKYAVIYERIGRVAANAVEKCVLTEQKRSLARESVTLGIERCRIEEIRLGLGHITRHKLMEILIEQTQREISLIQAATALIEAERELERLLNLKPGGLDDFILIITNTDKE